jgi:Cytochrome P450
MKPIREEVEAVISQHGWTKAAISGMRKLDSFMKEAQRMQGIGASKLLQSILTMCADFEPASMTRMALKEFTFSNGTHIPKGGFVSAVSMARHLDEEIYPDAKTFKGFRFSDIRKEEGEGTKNQMVATSVDYLPFGHGKHAW